nr:translation factor Sua5 [Acidobacteriota bacterium]
IPDGAAPVRVFAWGDWGDHDALARRLFDGLRTLDGAGVSVIACPVPEGEDVAAAIRDRLEKAARAS